jgi:hypothetical protein
VEPNDIATDWICRAVQRVEPAGSGPLVMVTFSPLPATLAAASGNRPHTGTRVAAVGEFSIWLTDPAWFGRYVVGQIYRLPLPIEARASVVA